MKKIFALDADAVEEVAQLGGLNDEQVSSLVSRAGRHLDGVRTAYRGEAIVSRATRNPVVRGCPACLQDSVARTDDPLSGIAMSGAWLLRSSLVCFRHEHHLVPLWSERWPRQRYDTQAWLYAIPNPLHDGSINQSSAKPTPYDRWLDRWLATQTDTSWLGAYFIDAATIMSFLVGLRDRHGIDDAEDPNVATRRAYAAGYDVLARGEACSGAFLDDLL